MTTWLDSLATSASFWTSLNAFFGAVLGASFYVLVKTQPYRPTVGTTRSSTRPTSRASSPASSAG